jgi:hypothetical protein
MNVEEEALISQAKFYSGDWSLLSDYMEDIQFDFILTTDTLYSVEVFLLFFNQSRVMNLC